MAYDHEQALAASMLKDEHAKLRANMRACYLRLVRAKKLFAAGEQLIYSQDVLHGMPVLREAGAHLAEIEEAMAKAGLKD